LTIFSTKRKTKICWRLKELLLTGSGEVFRRCPMLQREEQELDCIRICIIKILVFHRRVLYYRNINLSGMLECRTRESDSGISKCKL
jgi:hypothetical protein